MPGEKGSPKTQQAKQSLDARRRPSEAGGSAAVRDKPRPPSRPKQEEQATATKPPPPAALDKAVVVAVPEPQQTTVAPVEEEPVVVMKPVVTLMPTLPCPALPRKPATAAVQRAQGIDGWVGLDGKWHAWREPVQTASSPALVIAPYTFVFP